MMNSNRFATYMLILLLIMGIVAFSSCQTVVQRKIDLTDSLIESKSSDSIDEIPASQKDPTPELEPIVEESETALESEIVVPESETIIEEPEPLEEEPEQLKSASGSNIAFFDGVTSASRMGKSTKLSWIDQNGIEQSLSSYGGKLYLIDVWAEWCGPCKMSTNALKALYGEYKDVGLVVIGINIDRNSSLTTAMTYAKDVSIPYPIISDPEGANVGGVFVQRGIPNFTLVDSKGSIVHEHTGAIQVGDPGYKEIENAITSHLGK